MTAVCRNAMPRASERETDFRRSSAMALAELPCAGQVAANDRNPSPHLAEEVPTERAFARIVGTSEPLRRLLQQVEQVGPTDATVLIEGETGTGKELLARALHDLSARREGPMLTVNCGAISPGLVESELFGHERGAFTGAVQKRIGRFELAEGGTLFLDELGELSSDAQVKLLRALQEREFERVGGNRSVRVDVRVIAATNRNLLEEIRRGRFRMDLYYRLSVFPLKVPPLRERAGDLPVVANHIVARVAQRLGRDVRGIAPRSLERLAAYAWPGNIRELENVLERAVILARGPLVEIEEPLGPGAGVAIAGAPPTTLEQVEREHILTVLGRTAWSIAGRQGAAAILGLNPSTLRSRMAKLGIRRPAPASAAPGGL